MCAYNSQGGLYHHQASNTTVHRRRKGTLYHGPPNFPIEELYIGPFKIPLEGKNNTPPHTFDPLKHFSNFVLTQHVVAKNADVSLALLAEDPHNPFYESLRSWFKIFPIILKIIYYYL